MLMPIQKSRICKKLKYGIKDDPTIIFGIIVSEDDTFLIFKTARKEYRIAKSCIFSIEDTSQEFKEDESK